LREAGSLSGFTTAVNLTPALRPKITRVRRADKVYRIYHLAAVARYVQRK